MEDTKIPGVRFSLGNKEAVTDRRWWDQAEPVWVTAEKQGVRTATMFWPGSEAQIHGVRPSQWLPFNGKLPASARVETVLQWLDQPEPARPAFLTLYFDEVDHAGHEFGPGDAQTTQAVARVDDAIGQLMAGLEKRHLAANIVIVSDHGMAATSSERLIELDQVTPPSSYRLVNGGTYAGIEATPGQESLLASALLRQHEHMQCWPKAEIPARFHYGHNSRVPAFVCLAEIGWLIFPNNNSGKKWQGGAHGYDNLAPEMQSLFIASGPAFKKAIVLPPFDNVDVYPLIMQLIGVTALPSDGVITPILPAMQQRTQ
jgi:predicted AlkP superfamily pyrophosphatase or phosphodiesterase